MSPQDVSVTRLTPILDLNAAAPLAAELVALRGAAVSLDASAVTRLGGLCLQVLLSAQTAWVADRQPFHIIDPSPAFSEALSLFGALSLEQASGTGS
jgi:chemotaxis protein CheX